MPSVLSLSSSSSSSPSSSDSLATADDCARLPNVTGAVRSALSRSILALAAARTSAIRLSASAFCRSLASRASQQPATAGRRRQTNRSEKKNCMQARARPGIPPHHHESSAGRASTHTSHNRRTALTAGGGPRARSPRYGLTPATPCATPSRCCRPSNLIQSSALAHSVESPGSYLGTAGSRDFPCRPPSGALEAQSLLRHLSQSPPLAKGEVMSDEVCKYVGEEKARGSRVADGAAPGLAASSCCHVATCV